MTTTVAYNNRNLVTGISYSDPTPAVNYAYDNYGARTALTDGEGSLSLVYDSDRQLSNETRVLTGLTGKSYKLSYSYGLGGQLQQANYAALNTTVQNQPPAEPSLHNQVAAVTSTPPLPERMSDALSKLTGKLQARPTLLPLTGAVFASGTVQRTAALGGQPIAGATVSARRNDGSNFTMTTTSDANGNYYLGLTPGYNYAWTVTKPGWTFPNDIYNGNSSGYNFTGSPTNATTTISGTVKTRSGSGISGVTLNLTGTQTQTTTSDASGNYSFTVNTLGAYTIIAAKSGSDFTPVQAVVAAELVLPRTVNFKGAPIQQANTPPSGNTLFSQNVNYAYKSSGALDSVGTSMIGGDALSTTNVIDSLSYRAFGKASQIVYGNDRKLDLTYNGSLNQ